MATYIENNNTFSGADITVGFMPDGGDVGFVPIGDIQTISVSDHTDRGVTRRLGYRNYVGYGDGPRTVAGSMIFTVMGDSPLSTMLYNIASNKKYLKLNQLPPVNFLINLSNEYSLTGNYNGAKAVDNGLSSAILGVLFQDNGIVYTIEDIKTELTGQFRAWDYYPLMPHNKFSLESVLEGLPSMDDLDEVLGSLV